MVTEIDVCIMNKIKITLNQSFRNLMLDDIYEFDDQIYTIVVGDNGCGKTSLFRALRGYKNDIEEESLEKSDLKELAKNIEVEHNFEKIFYYDAVNDNGSNFMNAYDASAYVSGGGHARQRKSNGEGNFIQLSIFMEKMIPEIVKGKSLLVIDELDTGFSLLNMGRVDKILESLYVKYGLTMIVITHNPILMLKTGVVYDFVNKKLVDAKEYVEKEADIKF